MINQYSGCIAFGDFMQALPKEFMASLLYIV